MSNAPRWHRLTDDAAITRIRAQLDPRSRILVWPDLGPDLAAVAAELTDDFLVDLVIQLPDESIFSRTVDDDASQLVRELLAGAKSARAITARSEGRAPLLAAVLPDPDGVVRARQPPT